MTEDFAFNNGADFTTAAGHPSEADSNFNVEPETNAIIDPHNFSEYQVDHTDNVELEAEPDTFPEDTNAVAAELEEPEFANTGLDVDADLDNWTEALPEFEHDDPTLDAAELPPPAIWDWSKLHTNRKKLIELATWQEIAAELPLRVKASALLIIVLLGLILWFQTSLSYSAQAPEVVIILPTKTAIVAIATSVPATLAAPVEALTYLESVSAKVTATPTIRPLVTAIPTPLFQFHRVQANETLISIAALYNVNSEALMVANEIRDPTSLAEGQYLLIPPKEGTGRQKIMVHQVKEGETLLSIASKYGSSIRGIQIANPNIVGDLLTVGETVAVPIVFTDDNLAIAPESDGEAVYHTIRPGDIPLTIAAEYDIPVEILLNANDITDPTRLRVGQKLLIPPHDGLSLGYPVILYVLDANDTLIGIASRFNSSVKDILAVNPELDPATLTAGQTVAIPVIFIQRKPTPAPSFSAPPPPAEPPPALPSLALEMVNAINHERENKGFQPYLTDDGLTTLALAHAQDMVMREFVAHVNPEGQSPRDRLEASGLVVNLGRVGENIQVNSQPQETTVKTAIDWFMNSRPHRAGILNEYYNRVGVATVQATTGWYYFVIVFAQME